MNVKDLKIENFFINNLSEHKLRIIISLSNFGTTCNIIIEDSDTRDIDVIIDSKDNTTESLENLQGGIE